MGVTFGGKPCLDVRQLVGQCQRVGLPVGDWADLCNDFTTTSDITVPGVANLLMLAGDVRAIQGKFNDLIFDDETQKMTVAGLLISDVAETTPGYTIDDNVAVWVRAVDARVKFDGVVLTENFNCYLHGNAGPLDPATIRTDGSAAAWSYLYLARYLGGLIGIPAGFETALPATVPYGVDWAFGRTVAEILKDAMSMCGYVAAYDPFASTPAVPKVRLMPVSELRPELAQLKALVPYLLFDSVSDRPPDGNHEATAVVRFRSRYAHGATQQRYGFARITRAEATANVAAVKTIDTAKVGLREATIRTVEYAVPDYSSVDAVVTRPIAQKLAYLYFKEQDLQQTGMWRVSGLHPDVPMYPTTVMQRVRIADLGYGSGNDRGIVTDLFFDGSVPVVADVKGLDDERNPPEQNEIEFVQRVASGGVDAYGFFPVSVMQPSATGPTFPSSLAGYRAKMHDGSTMNIGQTYPARLVSGISDTARYIAFRQDIVVPATPVVPLKLAGSGYTPGSPPTYYPVPLRLEYPRTAVTGYPAAPAAERVVFDSPSMYALDVGDEFIQDATGSVIGSAKTLHVGVRPATFVVGGLFYGQQSSFGMAALPSNAAIPTGDALTTLDGGLFCRKVVAQDVVARGGVSVGENGSFGSFAPSTLTFGSTITDAPADGGRTRTATGYVSASYETGTALSMVAALGSISFGSSVSGPIPGSPGYGFGWGSSSGMTFRPQGVKFGGSGPTGTNFYFYVSRGPGLTGTPADPSADDASIIDCRITPYTPPGADSISYRFRSGLLVEVVTTVVGGPTTFSGSLA